MHRVLYIRGPHWTEFRYIYGGVPNLELRIQSCHKPVKPGEPAKSLFLTKKPRKRHFFRGKQRLKPGKWTFSLNKGKMVKFTEIPTVIQFLTNY